MPDSVSVPEPTLVNPPLPLMMPPKVPEPPMLLAVLRVILLFKMSLVPVKVSAPALLIPVPFKVIAFVLPKVPLLKPMSKFAPLVTEMLLVLLSALLTPKLKLPALTLVAPE